MSRFSFGFKSGGTTSSTGGGGFSFGNKTGSTFGSQQASTQQQTVFVKPENPFSSLPDNYKKIFAEIEAKVRSESSLRDRINDHLQSVAQQDQSKQKAVNQPTVDSLAQRLATLNMIVSSELNNINELKRKVKDEVKFAENAERSMARLTATQSSVYTGSLQEGFMLPSRYHWLKLEDFRQRMSELRKRIEEVDEYLACQQRGEDNYGVDGEADLVATYNEAGFEYGSGQTVATMLHQLLERQYDALVVIAGKVGRMTQQASTLRTSFLESRSGRGDDPYSLNSVFRHRNPSAKEGDGFQPYITPATAAAIDEAAQAAAVTPAQTNTQGTGTGTGTSSTGTGGGFKFGGGGSSSSTTGSSGGFSFGNKSATSSTTGTGTASKFSFGGSSSGTTGGGTTGGTTGGSKFSFGGGGSSGTSTASGTGSKFSFGGGGSATKKFSFGGGGN